MDWGGNVEVVKQSKLTDIKHYLASAKNNTKLQRYSFCNCDKPNRSNVVSIRLQFKSTRIPCWLLCSVSQQRNHHCFQHVRLSECNKGSLLSTHFQREKVRGERVRSLQSVAEFCLQTENFHHSRHQRELGKGFSARLVKIKVLMR